MPRPRKKTPTKPEARKEVNRDNSFDRIDPIAGKVKITIDHKTEVYVRPDRVEEIKRKYNLNK